MDSLGEFLALILYCPPFTFRHGTYCNAVSDSALGKTKKEKNFQQPKMMRSHPMMIFRGYAGLVLGLKGAIKNVHFRPQVSKVICFCWVLRVRKQMFPTQKCTLL